MFNIFDSKTNEYVGCFEYRPLASGAIIRCGGVNYNLVDVREGYILVIKREGALGQAATPDYNFDEKLALEFPHWFRVCTNMTDGLLGKIQLDEMPSVGKEIQVNGHCHKIVDWSIGQRFEDELYVEEVE